MACGRLIGASQISSKSDWLGLTPAQPIKCYETVTGASEKEARSLSLDLIMRGYGAGAADGHLVSMRRETASRWRQHGRSKPEQCTEGNKAFDIIWGLDLAIPEAGLAWTFDLHKPVKCRIVEAISCCIFCLLQPEEA